MTYPYPSRQVYLAILCGLFLRILMAWFDQGFRYMDEHWQIIEPANFLVTGHWSQATEWKEGLRSWIYPWLVSIPIHLSRSLGINDPLTIVSVLRSLGALMSTIAIPITAQLTWVLMNKSSDLKALHNPYITTVSCMPLFTALSAWFVAIWPFSIYCGTHLHGEMVGATWITLGTLLIILYLQEKQKVWRLIAGGICLSISFVLKIDNAVFSFVLGLFLLFYLRASKTKIVGWADSQLPLLYLALTALPFALLIGYIDKLTWGTWFKSVLGHAHVNLMEQVGNQWGVSPWYWHFYYFFTMGSVLTLAALTFLPRIRNHKYLALVWLTVLGYVGIFSLIPHKEKRFLAPLIYLIPALSFSTLAIAWEDIKKWFLKNSTVQKPVLFTFGFLFLTHFIIDIHTYLLTHPWAERVRAITQAGKIPGVQKMYSPQWPAVFYFPTHIPAVTSGPNLEILQEDSKKFSHISIATDFNDLKNVTKYGYHCSPWPDLPINPSQPRAYSCIKN